MSRILIVAVTCVATFVGVTAFAMSPPSYMIFYVSGGADISKQGENTIRHFVDAYRVKGTPSRVTVTGHTDLAEASMALSRARAEAVKDRLVELGVDADRIVVVARGGTQPLVLTSPGASEPQNRRVELVLQ